MALDVLKHFAEAARAAEADLQVRTRGGEAALLEEQPLLLDADDLGSVGDGRQGPARPQLGHLGVDGHHPSMPGKRHPVVAVAHEERLADLIDLDRREVSVRESLRNLVQPVPNVGKSGEKIAVDFAVPVLRPHNLLELIGSLRTRSLVGVRGVAEPDPRVQAGQPLRCPPAPPPEQLQCLSVFGPRTKLPKHSRHARSRSLGIIRT